MSTKKKRQNDYDMQQVKFKSALEKLGKEIVVGSKKITFKSALFSPELLDKFRPLPHFSHLNMSTLACAYVYISEEYPDDIDKDMDDAVYQALMTVFDKKLDIVSSEYVRYRADIVRYQMFIEDKL